ncbi:MAG: phage tail tape measure protein [Deltaproteobacteria bacterium]|nr:phage tail tape measure protein [Deltaproteobacteria bacterium]
MAESLRDYFVRFLFRTDKAGAKEAQTQIDGIARKIEKLAGLSFLLNELTGAVSLLIAPFRQFGSFVDATAREGDALGDLADRTGIATDKLEGYAFMAKLAGTNSETMLTGIRKLEMQMGEAAHGSKEAGEHFAKLGIRLRGANGQIKSVDQLLPEVSAAFQKIPSHAEKTALAIKLFGRAGQELLPFLNKGPAAIAAMQAELTALGGVSSKDFLEASSLYADNMDKMTVVWRGLRQALAGPIIKSINDAADGFLRWWRATGELVRSRVGEWAFQLVTSFKALGALVSRLSNWLLLLAAALNIPLLAMIGMRLVIGLLIDDFANWMAGNDSLIGRAIDNWENWLASLRKTSPVLAEVMRFFGGVIEWLHAGIKQLGVDWDRFLAEFDGDSIGAVAKGAFDALTQFLFAPFTETWDRLKNLMFDTLLSFKGLAQSLGLSTLAQNLGDQAAGLMRGDTPRVIPNGVSGPNGALAAGSAGGAAAGSNVNAQTTINVQAAPGMNEKKLAQEVGKQFDMRFDSAMRQGFNAVVPEEF